MSPFYIRRGYGYFGTKHANRYMPFLGIAADPATTKTAISALWACL